MEGRSARTALLSSALFPGLGQLYNEEGWRTAIIFAWEAYYLATVLGEGQQADLYRRRADSLADGETWHGLNRDQLRDRFHAHEKRQVDYVWYSSALFIASVLDAYVFAQLFTFETGDLRSRQAAILPLIRPARRSAGLQLRIAF